MTSGISSILFACADTNLLNTTSIFISTDSAYNRREIIFVGVDSLRLATMVFLWLLFLYIGPR